MPQPIAQAQRHFKCIPPSRQSQSASPNLSSSTATLDSPPSSLEWHAVRVCPGHGGVHCVNRHTSQWSVHHDKLVRYPRHSTSSSTPSLEKMDEQCASNREVLWQNRNCWLFDADDKPSVRHDGLGEKDRSLVDESHPKYVSLIRPCDIADGFAQVSAQGDVSLPGR